MNNERKNDLKVVADVQPELIQLQNEDYCPTNYRIVVVNAVQEMEEDND